MAAAVGPGMTARRFVALVALLAPCACFSEVEPLVAPDDDSTSDAGTSADASTTAPTSTDGMSSTGSSTMSTTTSADTATDEVTSDPDGGPTEGSDSDAESESSAGVVDDGSSEGGSSEGGSSEGGSSEGGSSEGGGAVCSPLQSDGDTVGLWHLDDGAGQSAVDDSGNARHLQLGSAVGVDAADPSWGDGVFDGGLSFASASEQYATRNGGNTFAANELSVEFWARTTSADYAQVFTAGFINCFVAINNNGAGVQFGIGDGNDWSFLTAQQPNGTLSDGQWHYIAATYDGATMRAFVDGLEVGSAAAAVTLANPGDYKVGGRPANTFLDGDMDEVRLSDIARTAEEIAAAYDGCG